MSQRSEALAARIEQGAAALAEFVGSLGDAEWKAAMPGDGRSVAVIAHHVASVYPVEIQLAMTLAEGKPITGVTMKAIHDMNAGHARDHAQPERAATQRLLRDNSKAAAAAVRGLTDAQLDRAAPVSLNSDAPLTCQFFIEDHALRHSFHHLAKIRTLVEGLRRGR